MEPRSRETTPTKEDLDFIVDDGYRHDVDPDYVPVYVIFQVEKKFILDHQIIQTTLFIKIKIDEINILLELKRLKINRGS